MRFLFPALLLSACSCGATTEAPVTPTPPAGPSYEVHEWGLVRSTLADRVMLSGPHAVPPAMPVAKPVLYFHRSGDGPLVVDVEVRVPSGSIAEHWPLGERDPSGTPLRWSDVTLVEGTCAGARYPAPFDETCRLRWDGCEAAELRTVETDDADCVEWGLGDAPDERWNHLFYRGEVTGSPTLGLHLEAHPDGSLSVRNDSGTTIPGRLVRIRRSDGAPDAAAAYDPPAPGATLTFPRASGPLTDGAAGLSASLSAAGLSDAEVAAFRRAWDVQLFGALLATTTPPPAAEPVVVATPTMPPPPPPAESSSLLWVLPASVADGLAELHFDPAPTAVRRAIVAWVDEAAPPPSTP